MFQTVSFDGVSGDRHEEQGRETGNHKRGFTHIKLQHQAIKDYFIRSGEKTSEEFFQGIQNALRENTAVKGGDKTWRKAQNRLQGTLRAAVSRGQGVNPQTHRGRGLASLGMGHSPDGTGQIKDNGKEARGQRVRLLNCRNHLGAGEHRGP